MPTERFLPACRWRVTFASSLREGTITGPVDGSPAGVDRKYRHHCRGLVSVFAVHDTSVLDQTLDFRSDMQGPEWETNVRVGTLEQVRLWWNHFHDRGLL